MDERKKKFSCNETELRKETCIQEDQRSTQIEERKRNNITAMRDCLKKREESRREVFITMPKGAVLMKHTLSNEANSRHGLIKMSFAQTSQEVREGVKKTVDDSEQLTS